MDGNGNTSIWKQAWNSVSGLLLHNQEQMMTVLRTPTPVKVSKVVRVDTNGCIGGGIDAPDPFEIYRCPMSQEAWLNRITVSSFPKYTSAAPLSTGDIYGLGSTAGEIIFFLPQNSVVAPVQLAEGRLSAPHLNPGEIAGVVGSLLPVGIQLRFDLQVMLVTGVSEYTPPKFAPGELAKDEEVIA
jgi:hypothetical protein